MSNDVGADVRPKLDKEVKILRLPFGIAQDDFGKVSATKGRSMREYELTYLISDNVPESDLNKVTGKVGGYVAAAGGKVLKEEIWGRRKLAYPIQKQEFATYVTINFEMPASKVNEFEKNIFMTSKIVRHLMIVKGFGTEELTLTEEDIAGTEAIAKVVGGEKSFEAVVGKTEESRDLMAKRDAVSAEGGALVSAGSSPDEGTPTSVENGMQGNEEVTEEEVAAETVEEAKKVKKAPAKNKKDDAEEVKKTVKPASKKASAKTEKPVTNKQDEADRLSKLDKELDDILGEDL